MKSKRNEILLRDSYVAPVCKVLELQSEGVLCSSDTLMENPYWFYDPDKGLDFV